MMNAPLALLSEMGYPIDIKKGYVLLSEEQRPPYSMFRPNEDSNIMIGSPLVSPAPS